MELFVETPFEDEKNLPYRRVWTKPVTSYARNYSKFDISLAPIKQHMFNKVKSQLKVIEAGFYKKALIATTQEVAKNLVNKVQVMNEMLPSWLRTEIISNNKLSLKFKNGSQIKAISSASTGARSEALSLLIIRSLKFVIATNTNIKWYVFISSYVSV